MKFCWRVNPTLDASIEDSDGEELPFNFFTISLALLSSCLAWNIKRIRIRIQKRTLFATRNVEIAIFTGYNYKTCYMKGMFVFYLIIQVKYTCTWCAFLQIKYCEVPNNLHFGWSEKLLNVVHVLCGKTALLSLLEHSKAGDPSDKYMYQPIFLVCIIFLSLRCSRPTHSSKPFV